MKAIVDTIEHEAWVVRGWEIKFIQFYNTFGLLPQVGDRLYNEESGVIVQDRSIDGGLRKITYTVSV